MGPLPTRWRKVGTTSNHHAPYDLGYTRATMGTTKRRETARLKLKGIDGGPHKQWSMWFNSKQREEPYQVLTSDA